MSSAAPSDQDLDQAAKIPVTQPPSSQGAHDVLQGAGQEGRESHPLSEAIFYKAEVLDPEVIAPDSAAPVRMNGREPEGDPYQAD